MAVQLPIVLFLGVRGAGKTSLAQRLMHNIYEESFGTAMGINVYSHQNKSYTIFDATSLEFHQPFVRASYPRTDLCVFVLDPSQPLDEQQDYFINEFNETKKVTSNAQFLLAINKSDIGSMPHNYLTALLQKIPFNAVVNCSAKAGQVANLEEVISRLLRAKIINEINKEKYKAFKISNDRVTFKDIFNELEILYQKLSFNYEMLGVNEIGSGAVSILIEGACGSALGEVKDRADLAKKEITHNQVEYSKVLRKFMDDLAHDVYHDKLAIKKAEAMIKSVTQLSEKVSNGDVVEDDIKNFKGDAARIEVSSKWRKLLVVLAGAALGFVVGAVVGMFTGPGMFIAAAAGAVVGASLVSGGLAVYSFFESRNSCKTTKRTSSQELADYAAKSYKVQN